ncbi:MAG: hypothetical protein QOF08_2359, partial [Gaiellales bacterium]|nr:hypothetical protein [Gaiellales bacterium]
MSKFAFWGPGRDPLMEEFRAQLEVEWRRRGYEFVTDEKPDAEVVFNFINPDKPKPFRRRQRSTYVTIIHALPELPTDVLKYEYPLMVRGLANLGMLVVPGDSCHFVTPERGVYSIPDPGDLETWVREIVD